MDNQSYQSNELIDRLPKHLKQFIKPQNYEDYSPINQAVWRYVMRKNVDYLSQVAHESYLDGLKRTGIDLESIPSMYGMNRILKEIGWAAVAVDGFIPPNAFMEFQAYKILVIASDIRQLENIEYTPAPDIIHESAGHAPIIANPDYAEYLRRFGEIGSKAILSKYDIDLYEAVRKLSILKEAEGISEEEIKEAEEVVNQLQNQKVEPSEMAQIRNLHWWSVEYGLIGSLENPKLFGAGLLSSIGESTSCMKPSVAKLPYSIETALKDFDITKPQPQLYVTPDFSYLMQVLEEFANGMSLRKGGSRGLNKLIDSHRVGTIELSTGLQISGLFTRSILNEDNDVIFFKTEGPSALAFKDKELIGHGTSTYPNGFCSPLGKLKNINLAIEDMGPVDLKAYNFYDGKWLSFEFESGIKVEGLNITGIRNINGKLMLIKLSNCTVSYQQEILFSPQDGDFDMVVGKHIISAYAGAADPNSFPNLYGISETKTIQPNKSNTGVELEVLYQRVRDYRNSKSPVIEELKSIFDASKTYNNEWLLILELYELSKDLSIGSELLKLLEQYKISHPEKAHLIDDGLAMI
ncbi:aromatic amino acid hydroxylase [Winogradskyella aurantiaca]|uniref:aromatic amino acid hydroxylase n=1 Tax=Winogradskyella aurantiaca TaxID=2219558 RepID=UPI000E1DFAA5|nr:aromatic amino acid hydroxylase [Winogradskyella aurantiaca]